MPAAFPWSQIICTARLRSCWFKTLSADLKLSYPTQEGFSSIRAFGGSKCTTSTHNAHQSSLKEWEVVIIQSTRYKKKLLEATKAEGQDSHLLLMAVTPLRSSGVEKIGGGCQYVVEERNCSGKEKTAPSWGTHSGWETQTSDAERDRAELPEKYSWCELHQSSYEQKKKKQMEDIDFWAHPHFHLLEEGSVFRFSRCSSWWHLVVPAVWQTPVLCVLERETSCYY